jgi:predicted kinase
MAAVAASCLGAPVLAWDWVMAGLTPFAPIQEALRGLDHPTYMRVGWSMLRNLAVAQLREGRSAVLDGAARLPEIEATRELAAAEGVPFAVVVTRCRDRELHRSRVEGRTRGIPGWHELTWDHVAGFLSRWNEPEGADLSLDAADPLATNRERLLAFLQP